MVSIDGIRKEIEQLRVEMENKAMEHQLNFLHPEVVHLKVIGQADCPGDAGGASHQYMCIK